MNCPLCNHPDHRVMATREQNDAIRRTRRCSQCGHSWVTREVAECDIKRAGEIIAKARELAALAE